MLNEVGKFILKRAGTFAHWFALIFADDDAHTAHPEAPTMKNFILFILLAIFSFGFLKVAYLMEIVVRHDVHSNAQTVNVFKSLPDSTQEQVQTQQTGAQNAPSFNTFQVPDIPSGWQYIFLSGMGILAAMSATKHIATMKYGDSIEKQQLAGVTPVQPDKS